MFPPNTKILLVEDMTSIREMIVEIFHSIGYKNIIASKDGADAWEMIQNASPPFELIVSDMNMPVSSGLDLLVRIRGSDAHRHLPFMMISEVSDQKKIMSVMKSGADYFLVKPVLAPDLPTKLKIVYDKKNGARPA